MHDRASVRVLVVDDHPVFRLGLVAALRHVGFGTVDGVEDGTSAMDRVRMVGFDVVVTDLKMPGVSGIELTQQLAIREPGLPVILLTTFDEPAVIELAERSGVRIVLSKETEPDAIGVAIDAVVKGGSRMAPGSRLPALTPREREVLEALLKGRAPKEIAEDLGLGPSTIKDHVANLYSKLMVHDRVGLILTARRLGYTTLQDLDVEI